MKKGYAREILENTDHQDAWVISEDVFFIVNGCCEEWDMKTVKTIWHISPLRVAKPGDF